MQKNSSYKSKCSFCEKVRVTDKYDLVNDITRKEMVKAEIDPYLYEIKLSYDICRKCRQRSRLL
jgi:hypothetical protein